MFLSPQILDILLRNWKSLDVEGKVSVSCGGMLQNSFLMWAPRAVSVQKANAGWKNMFLLALVLSDFQSSCLWHNSSWRCTVQLLVERISLDDLLVQQNSGFLPFGSTWKCVILSGPLRGVWSVWFSGQLCPRPALHLPGYVSCTQHRAWYGVAQIELCEMK